MKKLAIFGSGSGSNAENICNYFKGSASVTVVLICTNNKLSLIVNRAKKLNIPIKYTSADDLNDFSNLHQTLKNYNVDYIILAGFLLKIPTKMLNHYNKKILNIHPSLLPKYGGRGMYGRNVHRAVLKNQEQESGITIHFVNQNYDEGEIILQKRCSVSNSETVSSLEKKIRALEFKHFPCTIKKIILA